MGLPRAPRADSSGEIEFPGERKEAAAQMRDTEDEIREIKKEIIESRGLLIKTNNLINSLGADIKSVAKRQAGYERRFNWNGWVFLVVVAVLSFVGLKLASDARMSEFDSENDVLEARVQELRSELADETDRAEERARAEAEAARFYDLIRQQKRGDVVSGYQAVTQEKLSPAEAAFFRDTHDTFRLDLSVTSYQSGLELMRTGRYAESAEKFQEAIRLKDDGAHIPNVKYQLARALRRLGRQSEAIVYARQVMEQDMVREVQPDATYLLALCAEELNDLDTARDALRVLIRRWPRSQLARDARPQLRELVRQAIRGRQDAAMM